MHFTTAHHHHHHPDDEPACSSPLNNKQNYTSIRHHTRPPPKQNTSHQTTAVTGKYSLQLSPPSLETSHFPFSPGWLVSHHTTPHHTSAIRSVPSRLWLPGTISLSVVHSGAPLFSLLCSLCVLFITLFFLHLHWWPGVGHTQPVPYLVFLLFSVLLEISCLFFVCVVVVVCGTGGVRLVVSSRYTPPWCLPRRVGME